MKTELTWGFSGALLGALFAVLGAVKLGYLNDKDDTDRIAHAKVVDVEAGVCYAQFRKDPNYEQKLKELKALEVTQRDAYIQKGGWDKIPGQDESDSNVSSACATRIAGLAGN